MALVCFLNLLCVTVSLDSLMHARSCRVRFGSVSSVST